MPIAAKCLSLQREIFDVFCSLFNTAPSAAPQILLCGENAGIELRAITRFTLAVGRSNPVLRIMIYLGLKILTYQDQSRDP